MVVPLNHLGVELHKTINTNYSKLRERRLWEEAGGRNSYYFSFSLRLSSFLETGSRRRGVWWMDRALFIMRYPSVAPSPRNVDGPFKSNHSILEEIIVSSAVVSTVSS